MLGIYRAWLRHPSTGAKMYRLPLTDGFNYGLDFNSKTQLVATTILDDNPAADYLWETQDAHVELERLIPGTAASWKRQWVGSIATVQEKYADGIYKLEFSADDPSEVFWKRFVDRAGAGATEDGYIGTSAAPTGVHLANLIELSNSQDGNSFVRARLDDQEHVTERTLGKLGGMKNLGELVEDLSSQRSADGVDWYLDYSRAFTTDASGLILADFKTAFPLTRDLASGVSQVRFEQGIGRNNMLPALAAKDYTAVVTRAHHVVSGREDDGIPFIVEDHGAGLGVTTREAPAEADVIDADLRTEICDLKVDVLQRGRETLTFNVVRSDVDGQYVPGIDYLPGDSVRVRRYYAGRLRKVGAVRLYGINVKVSEADGEVAQFDLDAS